jgi:maltose/moltooligosaccharide transporter
MSVYFITEPTVFTMEWLQWLVLVCLGKYYLFYAMLSGSLPSDKMGYYMEFSTSLVIPS